MKSNKFAYIIGNETIYPEQVQAGRDILDCFGDGIRSTLLVAQPQQGKTGAAIYVADNFKNDARARKLSYQIIYLVCMNDNELKKQTRLRLRSAHLDDDVIVMHLKDLDDHEIETNIDTTLIIMDECHYAIDKGSPVHNFLLQYGIDYGNSVDKWKNDAVSVLSISATPFAHIIREQMEDGVFHIIPLAMNSKYYSLFQMMKDGRLIQSMPIVTGNRRITPFMDTIMDRFLADCKVYGNGYLVIRQKGPRSQAIRDHIKSKYGSNVRVESFSTNEEDEGDIVELDDALSMAPEKPTVVLIRGAGRAGKTFKTTKYLRGWYESCTSKSDAKLQALRPLGYASKDGHSKFDDKFPVYCNMREVEAEISFYERLLGKDKTVGVMSGIRNGSSQGRKIKYEYDQLVFDNRPTIFDVNAECARMGIPIDPSFVGFSSHVVSDNNDTSSAKLLANNFGYQQSNPGEHLLYFVNSPNSNWIDDWEKLKNNKPHMIGKWVVVVRRKSDKRVQKDLKNLIAKKTIFAM